MVVNNLKVGIFGFLTLSSLTFFSGCGSESGTSKDTNTTDPVTTKVNHAPVITGTPASIIDIDKAYNFTPIATDEDNDNLIFSISNKPSWASFDTSSGKLSGTPTSKIQGEVYKDINISVSDGTLISSLELFDISIKKLPFKRKTVKLYGSAKDEAVASSTIDKQGNIVMIGNTKGDLYATNNEDIHGNLFIIKTDSNGTALWTHQLTEDLLVYAKSVVTDTNNDIYVYGTLYTSSDAKFLDKDISEGYSLFVLKYNSNGAKQWVKIFNQNKDEKMADSIVVDTNNNLYLSGKVSIRDHDFYSLENTGSDRRSDIFIIKLNSAGEHQWAKVFGGKKDQDSHAMTIDITNSLYITGETSRLLDGTFDGTRDIIVLKVNAQGTLEWEKQYSSTNKDIDKGNSILQLNNRLYIAGTVSAKDKNDTFQGQLIDGLSDAFICELSMDTGEIISTKLYDDGGSEAGISLKSSNNNLFLATTTGNVPVSMGMESVTLYKLSMDGTKIYSKMYGAGGNSYIGKTRLSSMLVNNDLIYLLGNTNASPIYDQNNSGGYDAFMLQIQLNN